MDVCKAGSLNARLEGFHSINVLPGFGAATLKHWTPTGNVRVRWKRSIIAADTNLTFSDVKCT